MARKIIMAALSVAALTTASAARAGAGTTQLSDVIVAPIFSQYVQNLSAQKSALLTSGALVVDQQANSYLAGEGTTFTMRSMKDLDQDDENTSTDQAPGVGDSSPKKIGSLQEKAIRLSRNQSWSSMDLVSDLISADPMDAIAQRVSDYWVKRQQAAFVATMKGVFAMNAAAPVNGSTHTANDMTNNISGAAFTNGVTNFSASAFVDAAVTMGDNMDDLTLICVHSIVYARMLKNNLIEFIQPSEVSPRIPTFMGRVVVVDDGMPATAGVFESWLFGAGTVKFGSASPKVPTEVERKPGAGNGSGAEILYNRVEWLFHPSGHSFVGNPSAAGGPTNAATSGNLAAATSWIRTFPERKQIKIARLITREF